MMRVLVLLALVATGTWAETELERLAAELIEDFRSIMPYGRADIGIPVLDPVTVKQVPIDVNISPFNAKCTVSDITVPGISGFKFTKISQLPGTNKLAVSVELPDIYASGKYDLNGKVKIGFFKIKIKGNGPLTVALKGIRGDATADVIVNNDGSVHLSTLKVDSWNYDKLSINLENLMGGGAIGNTVNSLINKLAPNVINSNHGKISSLIENLGPKIINRFLDGMAGKHVMLNSVYTPYMLPGPIPIVLDEESLIITDEIREIFDELAVAAITLSGSPSIRAVRP